MEGTLSDKQQSEDTLVPHDTNDPAKPIPPLSPTSLPVVDGGGGPVESEADTTIETDHDHNPHPPQINYTIETASEEIDQFLTTFSTQEKEDDDEQQQSSAEIPIVVDKFLDLVDNMIAIYEPPKEVRGQWAEAQQDSMLFLDAVDRVSKLLARLDGFRSHRIHGLLVNRIGAVHQHAMSFLEDEFRMLLQNIENSNLQVINEGDANQPQEPETTEEHNFFPGYSDDVVSNLNKIAKVMIDGGYETECCQVYTILRRHAFDECLIKIGFEKISIDEVQKMHWETLEREIPQWIKTFKDCSTNYFSKEHDLAKAVFSSHNSISSSILSTLAQGLVIQLLNFAESVAMTKRSAEKLFKFLDVYEVLRDCVPAMNGLFSEECENDIKTEAFSAKCRIGEGAICIFCDLENSIKSDTGKTPVPGGAVHPLTRYTMNYLKYACEYKATLEQVFREHSKIERADSTSRPHYEGDGEKENNKNSNESGEDEEKQSPFSNEVMRVMEMLESNLDGKSKLYKDTTLSCIFMMNNGRYILQKMKSSAEINQLMGNTWTRKKSSDLRNYHTSYKRETLSKLLGCLNPEGLQVKGKVVKPILKERFKGFTALFEEVHRTQSSWVVSDEQLQSELRVSISSVVVPAYRSFLGRFSQTFTPGRQYEKYVKYQPEDLENLIDELFDGNHNSMMRKKP